MSSLSPEERQSLLEGPAGSPPPGQTANLNDPPNLRLAGRSVLLVLLILSSSCFLIRLYTRAFIIRKVKISDCIMLLAWGIWIGYLATGWMMNEVAPGVDQWNLRLRDLSSMLYYFHVGAIMYGICIFLLKLSILLQFLEIFSRLRDYFFWSCHCLIWVNFIFYTISTFLDIFACSPPSKSWDLLATEGSCAVDPNLLNVIASSVNATSDLIILILPQTRIWRLHMALRRKLAISAVFSFGLLASASSVVRLAYAVLLFTTRNNIAYFGYMAGLWTLPEIGCGIIAGCLPSSPKFFQSVSQSALVLKWRSSLQSLIPKLSRPTAAGASVSVQGGPSPPAQATVRWVEPDQYPLTSFASTPGTRTSTSSMASETEHGIIDHLRG